MVIQGVCDPTPCKIIRPHTNGVTDRQQIIFAEAPESLDSSIRSKVPKNANFAVGDVERCFMFTSSSSMSFAHCLFWFFNRVMLRRDLQGHFMETVCFLSLSVCFQSCDLFSATKWCVQFFQNQSKTVLLHFLFFPSQLRNGAHFFYIKIRFVFMFFFFCRVT